MNFSLSSIGSGIGSKLNDFFSLTHSGTISGLWDRFKNGDTNTVNKDIADQNLAFQRENLEYQKALQQKIFEREDSAYQRTVQDMRASGLYLDADKDY